MQHKFYNLTLPQKLNLVLEPSVSNSLLVSNNDTWLSFKELNKTWSQQPAVKTK